MAEYNQSNNVPTDAHSAFVDNLKQSAKTQRLTHERRWYDNNFFDDGFHFRYMSRSTGRIIDNTQQSGELPMRAIPKASRQIRGVANLLLGPQYVPVIYPDEVLKSAYPDEAVYQEKLKKSYDDASKIGLWITNQWEANALAMDLIFMLLLASKSSVSYLKIYPDYKKEVIKYSVKDAFELYLIGSINKLEDVPFIVESRATPINEILSNDEFDEEAKKGLMPDNKYAASEVKEAYMRSRFGSNLGGEENPTVILNEAWIKKFISKDNREEIVRKALDKDILKGKENGDIVMCHSFTAGGLTLKYEYLDMQEYPYVDLRFEPGPLYQVPFIDRFIPANKSLDIAMSRVEKYMNTMVTGVWLTRAGEDLDISNIPGGQKVTYKATKPEQMPMVSIPAFVFNYIDLLNSFIEEQGASTAALGQIPQGVKCVTPDTEVLTKSGFKGYKDISRGDLIYTVNPKTLKGEWKPIQEVHVYEDYKGTLVNIEGKHISASVTPNHKWLVKKYFGKAPHELIETQELKNGSGIVLGAEINDEDMVPIYSDDFVSLIGWVVTEGTYRKEGFKSSVVSISQSYKRNPKKLEIIKTLVGSLTDSYHVRSNRSNHGTIVTFSGELGNKVRSMFPEKELTYDFINALTNKQIKLLRKAMIDGDGNTRGKNKQERFFTTSETMLEMFKYICTLLGNSTTETKYLRSESNPDHKDYWECYVKKSKHVSPFNTHRRKKGEKQYSITKVEYGGVVWCPQTENGTFFARRNNTTYMTGNSGVAIESLKATEYANLKIPSDQLKDTIRRIAKKMIVIGSDFVYAQKFSKKEDNEFKNYAVIGERGVQKRAELDIPVDPETAILRKDMKVDIEVESGMGFTMEGKKQTMQQVIDFTMKLAESGMITQDQVMVITKKFLETYQFGATQEFMDGLSSGTQASQLNEDQLAQMKVAVAEVLKDLGMAGPEAEERLIETTKIGVVEGLKDTGMLDNMGKKEEPADKGPSRSISYKDLPSEGKAQLAAQAGIALDPEEIESEETEETVSSSNEK